MDLSVRIATWRKARKLSQTDLAKKVGVTMAAVFQWEGCGSITTTPTQQNLSKIVDALGLTMARFWGPLPKVAASS